MGGCRICPGIVYSLLKNKKIADIGKQKNEAMQPVKSLLNCKNREQNSGQAEHDGDISEEQAGRHGKWDKKAAESKHHE